MVGTTAVENTQISNVIVANTTGFVKYLKLLEGNPFAVIDVKEKEYKMSPEGGGEVWTKKPYLLLVETEPKQQLVVVTGTFLDRTTAILQIVLPKQDPEPHYSDNTFKKGQEFFNPVYFDNFNDPSFVADEFTQGQILDRLSLGEDSLLSTTLNQIVTLLGVPPIEVNQISKNDPVLRSRLATLLVIIQNALNDIADNENLINAKQADLDPINTAIARLEPELIAATLEEKAAFREAAGTRSRLPGAQEALQAANAELAQKQIEKNGAETEDLRLETTLQILQEALKSAIEALPTLEKELTDKQEQERALVIDTQKASGVHNRLVDKIDAEVASIQTALEGRPLSSSSRIANFFRNVSNWTVNNLNAEEGGTLKVALAYGSVLSVITAVGVFCYDFIPWLLE